MVSDMDMCSNNIVLLPIGTEIGLHQFSNYALQTMSSKPLEVVEEASGHVQNHTFQIIYYTTSPQWYQPTLFGPTKGACYRALLVTEF